VIYSWHRVDNDLPSKSRGQNSNTLIIPRATPHDEGMYYCKAKKSEVSVESRKAVVRVDGEDNYAYNAANRSCLQIN